MFLKGTLILSLLVGINAQMIRTEANVKRDAAIPMTTGLKCSTFDAKNAADNTNWYLAGDIGPASYSTDDDKSHQSKEVRVKITGRKTTLGARRSDHTFTYTFQTVASYTNNVDGKNTGKVVVSCIKPSGGGQDEQFKVNLRGGDLGENRILASVWIQANQECTLDVDFDYRNDNSHSEIEHRDRNR